MSAHAQGERQMKLQSIKSKRRRWSTTGGVRAYYRNTLLHGLGWRKTASYLRGDCSCLPCQEVLAHLQRWLEQKSLGIGLTLASRRGGA